MTKLILKSVADYRKALEQASTLRDSGATAETNDELANIEAAIAAYVTKPGRPARRKGRPKGGNTGM
ncbi:MAG: hypothetical protein WD767_14320 [Alphaproteobacteria bacterium]